MKDFIIATVFLLFSISLFAGSYFVSPAGNDKQAGTLEQPFGTIQKAVSVMQPGDTCMIREGRYHEAVKLSDFRAGGGRFLVFMNYNDEKVVLDGTESIKTTWEKHRGKIYKTRLDNDVWQLFVDEQMMSPARWPNGFLHDGSIWDRETSWEAVDSRSRFGTMYSKAMAGTGIDFTGAIAVMNIGSWRTYAWFVEEHVKGRDFFTYPRVEYRKPDDEWLVTLEDEQWFINKNREGHFYLESKLECLDAPGEWFYEKETKVLYLWAPDGKNPGEYSIRGKSLSYAFDAENSSHIRIEGLEFFGSTFRFRDCDHITIEDCQLMYPSYSKRMLLDLDPMDATLMVTTNEFDPAFNTIRNCRFEYMDGPAFKMTGVGNLVENCYIHDVDFSCVYEGGWTIHTVFAPGLVFRRNTVHTTGASELFKGGQGCLVELNNLSHAGLLQNDGAIIQISVDAEYGSVVRHNWVHNSVKLGLRFDNSNRPSQPWGTHGTMHHNVAWSTQRTFFKGDHHRICNNLVFDSKFNDLIISADASINGFNFNTLTRNNIAGTFSGSIREPGKDNPVPGTESNNWTSDVTGRDIRTQLRDPDNLDFRPKPGAALVDAAYLVSGINESFLGEAPDIGPYEYGEVNYRIPGYRSESASTPIPPDGALHVKTDADLMWLQGYKATSHRVYFGQDRKQVEDASPGMSRYMGEQRNNIFSPTDLEQGETYYWRIDALSEGKTVKGKVWSFTVQE